MKVLLIGATGNLGLRLTAALLTHKHSVVAYVRSTNKLQTLLPPSIYSQISVVEGNATNSAAIKKAILDNDCDGVVNTAGLAALAPWKSSDLPTIFRAVVEGVQQAGSERQRPMRAWFLAGLGVLHYPGSETMLASYLPIYLEHRQNIALLRSLPPNAIDWSMLCPANMVSESTDVSVPSRSSRGELVANALTPPMWQDSWVKYVPLIGKTVVCATNAMRYEISLEQAAEFIAADLETYESRWSGVPVGIITPSA